MALEDINMERVPESAMLKLPQINKGDLVLVSATPEFQCEWGKRLLFCSDGRVAQTDVSIADPYEIQRQAQQQFGEQTELELSRISRLFVDEAMKRGFLRQYVAVFGRDDGRYKADEPTVGIEFEILYRGQGSPLILFGADFSYAVGCKVKIGDYTSRTHLFNTLSLHSYHAGERGKIVTYPANGVQEILVGEEAILSKLRSEPINFILEKVSMERILPPSAAEYLDIKPVS